MIDLKQSNLGDDGRGVSVRVAHASINIARVPAHQDIANVKNDAIDLRHGSFLGVDKQTDFRWHQSLECWGKVAAAPVQLQRQFVDMGEGPRPAAMTGGLPSNLPWSHLSLSMDRAPVRCR